MSGLVISAHGTRCSPGHHFAGLQPWRTGIVKNLVSAPREFR
jgi:hypothetical protein